MATYYSDLWRLGRPNLETGANRIACTVTIPAGTAIATADTIKFFKLPAGSLITGIFVENPATWGTAVPGTIDFDGAAHVADIDLDTATARAYSLATTAAISTTADAAVTATIGTVTSGSTTGNRKAYFVFDVVMFKDNAVVYDWNSTASERIHGLRSSDG